MHGVDRADGARRPEAPADERLADPGMSLERFADSMPQLVWTASADGELDYFSARVGEYMGAARLEDGRWEWVPAIHPDDVKASVQGWWHSVATHEPYECEHRVRMADGTYRWHLTRAEPMVDSVAGTLRWFGYAIDVNEQKVIEERLHDALDRLQQLQAVTATLAAPLWDEDSIVQALLGDGVRAAGGDEGAVLLMQRGGRQHFVGGSDADAALITVAMREGRIAVQYPAAGCVQAAVAFPSALGINGGISVRYPDRAVMSSYDHAALRTVAELGAQALLRSRAYHDEQRRADQAEALQALASALAESTTVIDVANAIATFAGRSAGADVANVAIPIFGTDRLRLVHARSIAPEVTASWHDVGLNDRTPLSDAFRTSTPVFCPDAQARTINYPNLIGATTGTPIVATAALPMSTQDGRVVGALGFGWCIEQAFDDDDVALLQTVVSLSGQALQRARFFEAEQERQAYTDLARNASAGIAACTTLDEVVGFIVNKGAPALGATSATMFGLRRPEPEVLAWTANGVPPTLADVGHVDGRSEAIVGERSLLLPVVTPGTDRVVAVVHLETAHEMRWSAHRHRLAVVTLEWGQALERAEAHDAEQSAFRRAEQLQRVTASLAQATRSSDVVQVVETQLAQAFGVHSASLVEAGSKHQTASGQIFVPLDDIHPEGDGLVLIVERELTPADHDAAAAFAVGCARALSRTRLAERDHQIAAELQHALLGDVDSVDGLTIGTVYLASEVGLDIGGDWYDVIHRDDETAVLVVGDVVGHSLSAATAMGQLRSAVRALAHLCDSPEMLLEHVARYAANVRDARYSTIALVYLHVASGEFRYACAGHPPPLVVDPDGTTRFVELARNPPLGAFAPGTVRSGATVMLPGGSLVLYTDGLIEHRGTPIDDGLAEVARLAGLAAGLPPELLATRLVSGVFARSAPRDDVAVLAVSSPPTASRRWQFAADQGRLATVRHDMRTFMRGRGLPAERIDDMLLVAGEALANAVEHAYFARAVGTVEVRLEHRPDQLRLVVADHGGWRIPQAPGQRGRGVSIMRALADELVIEQRPDGTTVFARMGVNVG